MDRGVVDLAGRGLYWRAHGAAGGPPVVLLHSGLGSLEDWRGLGPALAERGYRAIAYDRWGYGRSDPREAFAPPGFDDDVADLLAAMSGLRVDRAALIGHSDGGTIALQAAARAPRRIAAVVAVAAHAHVELAMRPGIEALAARYEADEAFRASLAARHGANLEPLMRAWLGGWFTRDGWSWDIREELTQVRCPVLVVQGDADEYAPVAHAGDIAALTGGRLEIVPGVGHMVPQEAPEWFAGESLAFLERVGWVAGGTDRAEARDA